MKPSKATKLHNIVINPIIGMKMISIMGFLSLLYCGWDACSGEGRSCKRQSYRADRNPIDVIIKRIGGLMRLIELQQKTLRIRWGGQH